MRCSAWYEALRKAEKKKTPDAIEWWENRRTQNKKSVAKKRFDAEVMQAKEDNNLARVALLKARYAKLMAKYVQAENKPESNEPREKPACEKPKASKKRAKLSH